ncbi:predicted protein [Nematostella vectensis]|uniref:Uncharacterized protein n=1 Tax=Nematostella vectensis TaxID=45351 RepID=A7RQ11_NEMVE|nr:predicted protein [Nematostella vectensis]|eukprot:XP_001638542.1 predicted protein [Nematostella vectensis]
MANESRPKRRIVHRCLEYNNGLLHEEELALRRALQASIATSKASFPTPLSLSQKNAKAVKPSGNSTSTQTELKSSMKIRKKRNTLIPIKESDTSLQKKRKVRSCSPSSSRSPSPRPTRKPEHSSLSPAKLGKGTSKLSPSSPKVLSKVSDQDTVKSKRSKFQKFTKKKGSGKDTLLKKSFKVRQERLKRKVLDVCDGMSTSESGTESTVSSTTSSLKMSKRNRKKVLSHGLAQRKFASPQHSSWSSTLEDEDEYENPDATPLRARTEDFLTFLCLRGDPSLPKEYEVFTQPWNFKASLPGDESALSAPSSPSPCGSPLSPESCSIVHSSPDSQCTTPNSSMITDDCENSPELHAIRMFAGITNHFSAKEKSDSGLVGSPEFDNEDVSTPSPLPRPHMSYSPRPTCNTIPKGANQPHPIPLPPIHRSEACCSPPPLLYIPATAQKVTHLHGPPTLERAPVDEPSVVIADDRSQDSPPQLTKHLPRTVQDGTLGNLNMPIIVPSFRASYQSSMQCSCYNNNLPAKCSMPCKDPQVIDLCGDIAVQQRLLSRQDPCPLHSLSDTSGISIRQPIVESDPSHTAYPLLPTKANPVIRGLTSQSVFELYSKAPANTAVSTFSPHREGKMKLNSPNKGDVPVIDLCDPSTSELPLKSQGAPKGLDQTSFYSACKSQVDSIPTVGSSPVRKLRSGSRQEIMVLSQCSPSKDGPETCSDNHSKFVSLSPPWTHLQASYPHSTPPLQVFSPTLTSSAIGTTSTGYPSNYLQSQTTTLARHDGPMIAMETEQSIQGRTPDFSGLRSCKEPGKVQEGLKGQAPGNSHHRSEKHVEAQSPKQKTSKKNNSEKSKRQEDKKSPKKKLNSDNNETTPKRKLTNSASTQSFNPTSKKKSALDYCITHKPTTASPVLRPTEEEFKDPIKFLQSVQPSLKKYGICLIEPPESWKPESQLPPNLRFNSQRQLVHRLKERWGPVEIKLACIEKHLKQQGNPEPLKQMPQIGGMDVDLLEVSRIMAEFGGMQKVIDAKKWGKVADTLRIPKTAQDRIGKLQDVYCRFLLSYDLLSQDEKSTLEEQVKSEVQDRSTRTDAEKESQFVKKGKYHSAVSFQRVARNTQEHFFKTQPSAADVEREYWRIIQSRDRYVSVEQCRVDTGEQGSCFPVGKNNPYSKSGWNLNVFPRLKGSILRHAANVEGLSLPWLSIGMVFSTDRWKVHPLQMYTLSYLHTSADKVWYGVPEADVAKFPGSLRPSQADIHDGKDSMVSPSNLLRETGLTVTRLVQKQGQFVVVSPKAYHCSISSGYSISESVAFAFPDWLLGMRNLPKDVLEDWPSLPIEQMVIALSEEAQSLSQDVMEHLLKELMDIRKKECSLRNELNRLGVKHEKCIASVKGSKNKMNTLQVDGCSLYCEQCEKLCQISAVMFKDEGEALCLGDAVDLLRKDPDRPQDRHIVSCFSLSQIDDIIGSVKDRLQQLRSS